MKVGIYISAIPPLGEGGFLSKLKNREKLEGGLHEKKEGKREEKKKRVIKYLYEA